METGLKNKKALITGGASGIGFGIAKSLAKEGVDIAIRTVWQPQVLKFRTVY